MLVYICIYSVWTIDNVLRRVAVCSYHTLDEDQSNATESILILVAVDGAARALTRQAQTGRTQTMCIPMKMESDELSVL